MKLAILITCAILPLYLAFTTIAAGNALLNTQHERLQTIEEMTQ